MGDLEVERKADMLVWARLAGRRLGDSARSVGLGALCGTPSGSINTVPSTSKATHPCKNSEVCGAS